MYRKKIQTILCMNFNKYRSSYISLYSPKHGRNHRQKGQIYTTERKKILKNTCIQAHRPIS